jgi:hypothetical protein
LGVVIIIIIVIIIISILPFEKEYGATSKTSSIANQ